MGISYNPRIVTDGLVLALDGANYKSFKGVPATNILNQISYTSGNTNTALFKYTQGSENVNIPSLGYVNSKYVDFYNDYGGGSGNCCPTLFYYGTGLAASPSTTYTYSIIYKTTTGYSHPNYMYRYEFNSSGTYLTEAGVHSDSNRTSLGDGWWFAWGQFTTQATTARLDTYLYHYEYATQNRVYVYKAALYAGTYVIPPEHMLNSGEVRGATVATGGGWADIIGNSNNGELVNGPTYSSANGGSLIFDGTDDYVDCVLNSGLTGTGSWTMSAWFKINGAPSAGLYQNAIVDTDATGGSANMICADWSGYHGGSRNQLVYTSRPSTGGSYTNLLGPVLVQGVWYNATVVRNGTIDTKLYTNGSLSATYTGNIPTATQPLVRIGRWTDGTNYANCSISQAQIHNRALSAAEVQQNYNALASRFAVPPIVTDGLILNLDAGNSASYPGSGTTWSDLSGNGYNFNVNASAYSTTGAIPHMNFEGSFGAAKRGGLTDVPNFSNATIMCFSTILNSTGSWRTLIRASSTGNDHQVIIQAGANNLGMYDNTAVGFISSGFDITSLPNPYTQFNCLTWRMSQSSPYYQFQYNNNPTTYTITNANSTYTHGFSVIGAYHNESTGTGSGDSSQYWGKISVFLYYNRHLTEAEIQQNFNALRGRFGI